MITLLRMIIINYNNNKFKFSNKDNWDNNDNNWDNNDSDDNNNNKVS